MAKATIRIAVALVGGATIAGGVGFMLSSAKPDAGTTIVDFGDVDISNGPVTVTHVFEVMNASDRWSRVSDVVTTCGCIDAKIETRDIAPRATAALSLSVQIKLAGPLRHGAWVQFTDGEVQHYFIEAMGVSDQSLNLILATLPRREADEVVFDVDMQFVSSVEGAKVAMPIVEVEGVVEFGGWVELSNELPIRYMGRLEVRVRESDLPVTMRVQCNDLERTLELTAPD